MVQFRPLNLLHDFSPLGHFDIVFCRNVLIYFDQPTKADALTRIARQMPAEGFLVLGAAETVVGLTDCVQAGDREARALRADRRRARATACGQCAEVRGEGLSGFPQADVRHRPCSLRRGGAVFPSAFALTGFGGPSAPGLKPRGRRAEKAQPSRKYAPCCQGAAPFGAPPRPLALPGLICGVFLAVPGRALPTDRQAGGPPSASSSRGPLVVPGGAPAQPECVGHVPHARGRRASRSGCPVSALEGGVPVLRHLALPVAPPS